MEERQDRILGRCILLGAIWLGLHLFSGVRNLFDSFYETYDLWTFVWATVYAVALAALDIGLFFLDSRSAAKSWLRYWLFCSGVMVAALIVSVTDMDVGLAMLLPLLATPYCNFAPTLLKIFRLDFNGSAACLLLVCAAHAFYFFRLMRRTEKREEIAHG